METSEDVMLGWGFMENDGPVVTVQIRLAKGEITTTQYREIISRLLRNVSSFQQTSSIKILQMRYAKSELTADQYHEQMTNLMKKLYLHPWSPPLHILHTRYAEGEITNAQYEEMYANLTTEQFAYDQSTPLWIINNRYAQGELSTEQYDEIVSLCTDYPSSLQQEAMNHLSEVQINPVQASKTHSLHTPEPVRENPAKTSESLPELTNSGTELQPINHSAPVPVTENVQQPGDNDGSDIQSKITAIPTPASQDSSPVMHTIRDLPDLPTNTEGKNLPAADRVQHGTPSFSSDRLASPISVPESVRSSFLYTGHGNMIGGDEDSGDVRVGSELQINYSISPVSSSGGEQNNYETVTSQVTTESSPESVPDLISSEEQEHSSLLALEADERGNRDLNKEIKLLIVKGKYEEAVVLSTSITEKNAGDYRAFFLRGMSRYYLGLHDQALEDLNQAHILCKNKKEIRKIETIRSHILCKKDAGFDSENCPEPELLNEDIISEHDTEQSAIGKTTGSGTDTTSSILDELGKKAQDHIDAREFKKAVQVLREFIDHCTGLTKQQLRSESVDDIHAAMGYVMYQLKDYSQAKYHFQESLSINADNDVSNQFMKDILIRAAKLKK